VAEVDAELEVVLFATERDGVLELVAFLGPDLVEAVAVTHARQVERALDAVDADPLRRVVADRRERLLAAGNDLILGVGVLESHFVQESWRRDPRVADDAGIGRLLEIESMIGGRRASASEAGLLSAFLPVTEEQRLRRVDLMIETADEQIAGDRLQECALERRVELWLAAADGEVLIGFGALRRHEE